MAAMIAVLAFALAYLALPALCGATPRTHGHHAGGKHTKRDRIKPRSAYWGAWIDDRLTGEEPPWDMSAVTSLEQLTGKGLSLVEFAAPFYECGASPCRPLPFPTAQMESVRSYGAIPFFGWGSDSIPVPDVPFQPDFELSDVIAGKYDPYIRKFAEAARDWGHGFFLRFNWEMNGNWFPWGATVNNAQPGEYVAAWRHVHDIFTSVGATNATWVWCPYVEVKRRFAKLEPLYPGDSYVDWTCMDGFNWAKNPTNPHRWRSFDEIFRSSYREIVQHIAPTKPMILAEVASTGGQRAKAAWIRDMFKQLAKKYRRIRGLIWFNQVDRGIDWPLDTSPAAAHAFAQGIRRWAFKSNGYAASSASPVEPPN
jgi:mannan endo-1,4-beta-mannosidase